MCNILYVSSSSRGSASYSNRVAGHVIDELRQAGPQATVTVRDLARDPLPHIDDDFVVATRGPEGQRTDRQRAILAQSDALVDELLAADIVVIAAPMINFGVPTQLKSWFDHVARAGRTLDLGTGNIARFEAPTSPTGAQGAFAQIRPGAPAATHAVKGQRGARAWSPYSAYNALTPFDSPTNANSAPRETAVRECSVQSAAYKEMTWGTMQVQNYRACMAQRGHVE
jgi:putative NADPH-quinone reductase